jgi:cytoskeletal protein CcmA (bactofilin family)
MDKRKGTGSTSLLSRNVKIEGEILGEENLHVDGSIKGRIQLNGNLFVGTSGTVEADVQAINVVIQGKIIGNVSAEEQLEIQPSGELIGDCAAASIDIREGAIFDGRSRMKQSKVGAPKPVAVDETSRSKAGGVKK